MVNPIAFGMIVLGLVLLVFGIRLVVNRRKATGIAISLLGIGAAAAPFLVSSYLAR